MVTVTLYYRKNNTECDQTRLDILSLQSEVPLNLVEIDVDSDPAFNKNYGEAVPTVEIGPYRLKAPINRQNLLVALNAAKDRQAHYELVGDTGFKEKYKRGHTLSRTDRFSYWFSNHYMLVLNLIFFFYIGIPFLAPVFMKLGATTPAKVIYTIYSPLCHQLAFRSWFLFGEQAAYPRALAGVPGLLTFEQATSISDYDVVAARAFTGNEALGYKVAICERDVAIYSSILLFGIIFSLTGRKIKSIPWYLWIIIGILPIGVDGVSQLPDLLRISLPSWAFLRESTPLLRTITGFLFGFTTAWYGYPYIEDSMLDSRRVLLQKIAVIHQTKPNEEPGIETSHDTPPG
jgi:uncharacterized membrane protein